MHFMKKHFLLSLTLLGLCLTPFQYRAVTAESEATGPQADLQQLVDKVKAKIQQNEASEAALATELAEFDVLLKKYSDQKTDEVAQILLMKAMLYAQVFENEETATQLLNQLKTDYAETRVADQVDRILEGMAQAAKAKEMQKQLAVGKVFPDFKVTDTQGKPLSVAQFRGKVVLIDFWATWCGPCVQELPNVIKAYQEYHKRGFEVIGISLDRDKEKLDSFVAKKQMTWPQFFDGQGWQNELATKFGIQSIPATYLLDKQGKVIARDLRGDALSEELAKLLPE